MPLSTTWLTLRNVGTAGSKGSGSLQAPTRKSVGVYGAVSAADGRLVAQREAKFNAATFQQFLGQLLNHRRNGRKLLVVLDNSPHHHARALIPWLYEQRSVLSLDFLPPYSPKLNGIERVWKLTRRLCTHNRYFPVLDQLVDAVFEPETCANFPSKAGLKPRRA